MQNRHPFVTIGLMVYNEEKYIALAIASILEQDYSNYEIIIADNASTDRTGEIALKYADRDSRIKYFRHAQNIGALDNFNFLVRNANGKYFVLAGGHDLWSQNYITALTDALENHPGAVLAHAPTSWLDDSGQHLNKRTGFIDTSGLDSVARFNLVMWNNQHAMYGLYRLSVLRETRLQMQFVGSGILMLCELALQGDIILAPEAMWYRRMNRKPESREDRLKRYHKILFRKPRPIFLTHWLIPWYLFTSTFRGKIPFGIRFLLMLSAMTSVIHYSQLMIWDVLFLFARFPLLGRLFYKSMAKKNTSDAVS